jgi:OmcA/MtrC family decaheme c-type cytochrome
MTDTRSAQFRRFARALFASAALAATSVAQSQTPPPAWEATKYFRYDIENVVVTPTGAPSTWSVKVIFSVANPIIGGTWDIKRAPPFQSAGASLTADFGWDPAADFTNTGSANPLLSPIVTTALGSGLAIPVQTRNLQTTGAAACASSVECPGIPDLTNRYWLARTLTPVAFTGPVTTGRVAIEGKPVCDGVAGFSCPAGPPYAIVPVKSAAVSIALKATESLAAIIADPRRAIVDIAKCQGCHDGKPHGDITEIPRLSLHGGNRNENLGLCVMCHNANQTDVVYRYLTSGTTADPRIGDAETAIDFKTMVHSIHAGGFRKKPLVVIGFNSSVNDFSYVRFPATLRNCTTCHIDANGKGTFELPLKAGVLGTTVNSQSVYQVPFGSSRTINVNPFTHLKVSPTAAVCSSCHDESEAKSHMIKTGGAAFAVKQADIGTKVKERCAGCHGPGKDKDVRKVHEIRSSGGGGGDEHDD